MGPLVLRPLDQHRIRQAFPLVRAVLPETGLTRWTEFARGQTAERKDRADRGIVAAENQAGYIVGLFTRHIRDELALGRTLAIGTLLVADFPGRDQVVAHCLDGIEMMAHLRGCHAVVVDLDIALADTAPTCSWSLPIFQRGGFVALGANRCCKLLPLRRTHLASRG